MLHRRRGGTCRETARHDSIRGPRRRATLTGNPLILV